MNERMQSNMRPGFPSEGGVLSGKELDSFLLAGIDSHKSIIISHLADYDGRDLFYKWVKFIRCIDELINLKFVFPEYTNEWKLIDGCNIDFFNCVLTNELGAVLSMVKDRFGIEVSDRLKSIILMLSSIKFTFQNNRLPGIEYRTLSEAIDFCQSRRLYYVAYLSLIRLYAKGRKTIAFLEILCHFQYHIDFNMSQITTALHSIIGNSSIDGYYAKVVDDHLDFSTPYNQLEGFFLEPHIMNELDIIEHKVGEKSLMPGVPTSLYSYSELVGSISQAEDLFREYGIADAQELQEIKQMVLGFKERFQDDYSLRLSNKEFVSISRQYPHLQLCSFAQDYFGAINERPAFYQCGDSYYTTVLLLMRYSENTIYSLLRKNKRYRIKAGFMLEKKVESLLVQYGFEATSVKRIHRKEFDVLCKRNNMVFNFQCKNNFLDINRLSEDNLEKVCRQNKKLSRYYMRALDKENFRAKYVMDYFGVDQVNNYVVSRFPIVMDCNQVIPFNTFEDWLCTNFKS